MVLASLGQNIYNINEKSHHSDVSTIHVRHRKGVRPSHPCMDTDSRMRTYRHRCSLPYARQWVVSIHGHEYADTGGGTQTGVAWP